MLSLHGSVVNRVVITINNGSDINVFSIDQCQILLKIGVCVKLSMYI